MPEKSLLPHSIALFFQKTGQHVLSRLLVICVLFAFVWYAIDLCVQRTVSFHAWHIAVFIMEAVVIDLMVPWGKVTAD